MYYDLKNDKFVEDKKSKSLSLLYNTCIGRCFLKILTAKAIANIYAKYMNSTLSKHKIKRFINKNNICMEDYKEKEYSSFNDFFTRQIKPSKRKINEINVIMNVIKEGDYLVSECSCQQGENFVKFHPHVGVLTNFSEAHIDFMKTYEHYKEVKARMFYNQDENDIAIMNYSNPDVMEELKGIKSKKKYL